MGLFSKSASAAELEAMRSQIEALRERIYMVSPEERAALQAQLKALEDKFKIMRAASNQN